MTMLFYKMNADGKAIGILECIAGNRRSKKAAHANGMF